MAWNINPADIGGGPERWDRCRMLWDNAGIENFPWLHCRNFTEIDRLVSVAKQYNAPAIGLNIEDVVADRIPLDLVAQRVQSQWSGPVHMATLCWVQNGQGWHNMAFAVAALEIFIDEVPMCSAIQDCITHAKLEGLDKVTLMLKTKPPNTPSTYGTYFSVCHSLYTADDIVPSAQAWNSWIAPTPCQKIQPTPPPPQVPLTEKQFPYTGPFYGPSSPSGPTRNTSSIKGLKRGMIRGGFLSQQIGSETDDFGAALEDAFKKFQRKVGISPVSGQYGRQTWTHMRYLRVPAEMPNEGQYAMDALALKYVREDNLVMCYPHPEGATSSVCQGLHPTAGLNGNWAMDFCAPGGTAVLAVERAKITRLSGRDPALGADNTIGIFGWSIHYETASGYRYFSTHYGTRSVREGQIVDVGQVIGTVGAWPGEPSRSHTHLGVTSPLGTADAKRKITAVSNAERA